MRRLVALTALQAFLGALTLAGPVAAQPVVATGVVRSEDKIEIKSKLGVPVQRVGVMEGDVVTKGRVLIEMANDVASAHVESARAEVRRAEAGVVESEASVRRARSGVDEFELKLRIATRELERGRAIADLITQRELQLSEDAVDRAAAELRTWRDEVARQEAQLQTRREDVARAEAQLRVAQVNLEETRIRAPFDGLVSRLHARVGSTPKPSETTLLEFLTLERLYVEVAVPLAHLHALRSGMPVAVLVEDEHKAVATSMKGRVGYIYPEIDTTLRMVRVKVQLDRLDARIRPGMLAKITIDTARRPR